MQSKGFLLVQERLTMHAAEVAVGRAKKQSPGEGAFPFRWLVLRPSH